MAKEQLKLFVEISQEKRCSACHKVMPRDEFYKNKAMKDGLCNQCKNCTKVRQTKSREAIRHSIKIIPESKKCPSCGETKTSEFFGKDRNSRDGLTFRCKECRRLYEDKTVVRIKAKRKQQYNANPDKYREKSRNWWAKNRDEINQRRRDRRYDNQDEFNANRRKKYKEDPERIRSQVKRYQEKHPERVKLRKKIYSQSKEGRETISKWFKTKYKSDPRFKLNHLVRGNIAQTLKTRKTKATWDLLDYTIDELIEHLKKTTPNGYNWQDFMDGKLHVDHKIPIAVFNYTSADQIDFKRCWALENLQLLPAKDNLSKGAKIDQPFQPCLALEVVN